MAVGVFGALYNLSSLLGRRVGLVLPSQAAFPHFWTRVSADADLQFHGIHVSAAPHSECRILTSTTGSWASPSCSLASA